MDGAAHNIRSLQAIGSSLLGLIFILTAGCGVAAHGHNSAGVQLFQKGQQQAALQRFQQAVAADPRSADAYYNLAATVHQQGSQQRDPNVLQQAEALYNQCLDIDPNHVDCHRALAVLLVETDRSDRAFNLMKNWVAANPRLSDARVELARLYEEFGDGESAMQHLQAGLSLDQSNSRAWAALGRLREEVGDTGQALANYQRSLSLNRFQPGLADRIAALQRNPALGPNLNAPGGTRTVSSPQPWRY